MDYSKESPWQGRNVCFLLRISFSWFEFLNPTQYGVQPLEAGVVHSKICQEKTFVQSGEIEVLELSQFQIPTFFGLNLVQINHPANVEQQLVRLRLPPQLKCGPTNATQIDVSDLIENR